MLIPKRVLLLAFVFVGIGVILGYSIALEERVVRGADPPVASAATKNQADTADDRDAAVDGTKTRANYDKESAGPDYLRQSAGVSVDRGDLDFGLADGHISKLLPYPQPCREGDRTPLDLWRYGGRGNSSWGSPNLRMAWDDWVEFCIEQKPKLMQEVHDYMNSRYDFRGNPIPGVFMSGGRKPVP
ncbi:MAG: hypothetical protein O3C40_17515, partial [Planctomycetota bacterium]|nr:hypothetical protein [Planctomycetota bacterium]